jgi:nicotinamidase-related amidase
MSTALLVIDMQKSLLGESPWNQDALLLNVRALIDRARSAGAPVVFVTDTRVEPDASIDDRLAPRPTDPVVSKDFSDSFSGTGLLQQLQGMGIDRLVVCGLQTDYCIDTTCRRAASLGYTVVLASDAHSTFDHEFLPAEAIVQHHNRILRAFPAGRGTVSTVPAGEVGFA